MEDLNIKCDAVEKVGIGVFRGPELEVSLANCDYDSLVKDVGIDKTLDVFGIEDLIAYIEEKGYTVTEE